MHKRAFALILCVSLFPVAAAAGPMDAVSHEVELAIPAEFISLLFWFGWYAAYPNSRLVS